MTRHKQYKMRDQTENGNMHRRIEKSDVFKTMFVCVEINMNANKFWEAISEVQDQHIKRGV